MSKIFIKKINHMKKQLGQWGENLAAAFLIKKGYQLLAKNWRTRFGEVDLVMRQGETNVFVEVKTRRGLGFGYPEDALSAAKLEKLECACEDYLASHNLANDWRLDCLAIIGDPHLGIKDIQHIEGWQA
jgi:putative endonuclease